MKANTIEASLAATPITIEALAGEAMRQTADLQSSEASEGYKQGQSVDLISKSTLS